MREPVQVSIPWNRTRRHILNFLCVVPLVGLACATLPAAASAQDMRPPPSAATGNGGAAAADIVGDRSTAPAGTPSAAPTDDPTIAAGRVEAPPVAAPTPGPAPAAATRSPVPEADPVREGGPFEGGTGTLTPAAPQGISRVWSRATGALPDELSPWSMFVNADVVVKTVILGLALASVVTWTVWLAKIVELRRAKRGTRGALHGLLAARSLAEAADAKTTPHHVVAQLIAAAQLEIRESPDLRPEGIKERLSWQLDRIEVAAGRHVARGMSILATIGAVAPFVGLFGTVWGIMNSFVGISRAHTTNLAVVAPGIAEALLATAFGLAAAIPAVVIYNAFTRSIGGYRALLADASIAVLRLVSRDLDRQAVVARKPEGLAACEAPTLSVSEAAE